MDIASKIRAVKEENQRISDEERLMKARIEELKGLVAEQEKARARLEKLREEEAAMLRVIG